MRKHVLWVVFCYLVNSQAFAQGIECSSQHVRDSLFAVYSARAQQYSFEGGARSMTFDSLLSICPNISEAYQEKSKPYLAYGNYDRAFEQLDKAVSLDSARWTAYRGYLHFLYSKNYEKAIVDLLAAEKMAPYGFIQDHSYAFFTGLSYMQLGDYAKAEIYFGKDLAQQKRGEATNDIHYNSFFYRGMLSFVMKEYTEAEDYFRKCLHLYEQHPMANYYLAMTLKIIGNSERNTYFDKAQQYLREGYKLNEPFSYVHFPFHITLQDIQQNR